MDISKRKNNVLMNFLTSYNDIYHQSDFKVYLRRSGFRIKADGKFC